MLKARGLLVAVVLLAALSGGIYWSNKAEKAKEGKPAADAPPKLLTISDDQVQQFEIKKKDGDDIILQRTGGKWQMTAPKPLAADQDAVNSVTTSFGSLTADRVVEDKAADLTPYGLNNPTLTLTITKKDGKVDTVQIGDETPTSGGFFARVNNDPRVFTIASYSKTSFDKSPKDLRDKRLLTFDSDKLTRVELNAKKQSVEFGKNAKNDWTILKPKPLRADGGQVEDLIRKLKDAKMDTSVSDEDAKKAVTAFASGTPVAVAKVTDASGTQQLEVRKDKDKNYYAKGSAVEGVWKVASDLGDGLDKSIDDFRNKKLFDFGFSDPTKVEIRDGAKTMSFQKSGDKWMSNGKQMDSTSVQALVDKLRDLASIKFVEQGFTAPLVEATVTSNDGKSVDKVLISKSGNSYFAKRENEPSIYEVDGKAVEEIQKTAGDVKEAAPPTKDAKKK